MTDFQKKLLDMLSWFVSYLDSNNIEYYAVGGTLLGAVRHKGFIPWDDDIDIAIPRPDYIKLINSFDDPAGRYKLETPYQNNKDYLFTFSKLFDTQTTLIERQRKNIKRGIYIDVFPLDGLGETKKESVKFFKRIDSKNMFLMTRTCAFRAQRKWYKNIAIFLARLLPFVNNKKYSLKIDQLASKKDYNSSLYVANLSGAYREREITDKRVFRESSLYKFENIQIKGPKLFDEYLTQIYHNWHEIPPVEKRGKQHDIAFLDLDKSYLDVK